MTSPAALLDLDGTVALVTGANGGIGSAIALRLSQAGAAVALATHRATELAEATAQTIRGDGGRAEVLRVDLADVAGPERLVAEAVENLSRLDIVVNNAGIQPVEGFLDIDAESWGELVAVNLSAVHLLTRAAAEVMIAQGEGGSIVNIGSIEGLQPAPGHSHYAATKAAVAMHARAAASELGEYGIRVNTVLPGLIDDGHLAERWPEGVDRWLAAAPLARLGTPDDVADAVVFLASPLARWISGAELVVDGAVLTRPTW
jgi:3-oxoacyl-[acyl-carrier protein] reductase